MSTHYSAQKHVVSVHMSYNTLLGFPVLFQEGTVVPPVLYVCIGYLRTPQTTLHAREPAT